MSAPKLTASQRRALESLIGGAAWWYTRTPRVIGDVLDGLPPGLVTRRYSSIGESSEKVHYVITPAGRAALKDGVS